MIVRMKELLLFTSSKTTDESIYQLGELGVVDIQKIEVSANSNVERYKINIKNTESAIACLERHEQRSNNLDKTGSYSMYDPKRMVERILQAKNLEVNCKNRLEDLYKHINWYHIWGKNVNVNQIQYLKERGIYLKLYMLDKNSISSLKQEHSIFLFEEFQDQVPSVLVSLNPYERLEINEIEIPSETFESLEKQILRKERQLAELEVFLNSQVNFKAILKDYLSSLNNLLAVEEATQKMKSIEERCNYLRGFIPVNEVDGFKNVARKNNWGYHITDPRDPENVPVFIKNPKWIEIINPVMKFIDIVPGYKEVDVSIYFLVAFALFFAMLVGDAGYGLIFLIISIIFRKKLPKQMSILILVLSVSTMIWGVLSGTYFGSSTIAQMPIFKGLIIENIASFGIDNVSFMMHLSFLIGAIHLSIAHGIRSIQFINSIKALGQIGWIALVWGLFFITEQLVLGDPMPSWGKWLFVGGGLLVALFSAENKHFFKSILTSLANLPLSLISGFSDIVSYVRLFAVGMATAAVAASFNNMVLSSGIETMGFLDILMAAIALLLGHGLNITLALMAVMVHGIRLNMLEFASHLGINFTGEEYRPFRLISDENLSKFENIKY